MGAHVSSVRVVSSNRQNEHRAAIMRAAETLISPAPPWLVDVLSDFSFEVVSQHSIDEITRTFDLSMGERQFLLSADRGQGLLSTGTQRVAFQSIASPVEHELVTSSPEFLATLQDSETNSGFVELGADDTAGMPGSFDEGDASHIELDAA